MTHHAHYTHYTHQPEAQRPSDVCFYWCSYSRTMGLMTKLIKVIGSGGDFNRRMIGIDSRDQTTYGRSLCRASCSIFPSEDRSWPWRNFHRRTGTLEGTSRRQSIQDTSDPYYAALSPGGRWTDTGHLKDQQQQQQHQQPLRHPHLTRLTSITIISSLQYNSTIDSSDLIIIMTKDMRSHATCMSQLAPKLSVKLHMD